VRVASIARHTFLKLVRWQMIHELSENSLADIHPLLSAIAPEASAPTGYSAENFQVEKSAFPPNQLIPCWLFVG
jgi:hypothetical protein